MKILKIAGITLGSIIILLYAAFLFILPNVVNIDKFKPEIQKIAKEQADLNLNFDKAKISVTPLLSAGLKADNISVTLPDESPLVNADNLTLRVSLPHLLFKTVKVTKAEMINPVINIDIVDGKEYKLEQIIKDVETKQKEQSTEQTAQKPAFDASTLKIDIPEIKIVNYSAVINDLLTGDFLKLRGDELLLGYNGKKASVKTNAEFFVNDKKNISANVDIDTVIPAVEENTAKKSKKHKKEKKEMPFINPVAIYKAYDLKANLDTKLRIREQDNKYISNGHLKIDNFTLMLSGLKLPESNLHITTAGTKADFDSEIYVANEEKIALNGMVNYGKKAEADVTIKSDELHTQNILELATAAMDSANVENELNTLRGEGFIKADAALKTDYKTITSNGNITVQDCELINKKDNFKLAKINSIISLDDNIIKFVDTTLEVMDTIFKVDGTINQESVADISLVTEKLPVERVVAMFAPQDIKNTYNVNSGAININANIKGELSKPAGNLKLTMNNLSLTDRINKINYLNNILVADFTSDFKTYKGTLKNNDFRMNMNGVNVNCNNAELNVGDKDITVNPAKLRINNSTDINFSGNIKNYIKNPVFDFIANGSIRTQDLKQLLGPDISPYVKNAGTLPLNAKITGDSKQQTLTASVEANSANYITPVHINSILNKTSVAKTTVDLKGDKLTIRDTGLYSQGSDKNAEIIGVEGTITKLDTPNPSINMIKVKIPNDLHGSICLFPKSKVSARGNMYISGNLNAPKTRGNFDIWNLSIPEIMVTMEKAVANIEGNALDVNVNKLLANGSDYNLVINADLTPSAYFTIKNLNVISNFTDAEKVTKVTEALDKYMPKAAPAQSSSSNKTSAAKSTSGGSHSSADIPVIIKDGTIDMKEIKSGTITLKETTGKISLAKNIFYINNLLTSAFKGKIKGDVSMNMLTSDIKAAVKGDDLNVEQTLLETAGMKDTLTGTMDFDADLSLRGSTYEEQVRTLKGKVNFTMKNGTLGPFGRIENLIIADNIRQNQFFKTALGSTINQLTKFDTTHFTSLTGNMNFNNGIAQINPITSTGDVMSTYIFGNFDILKNYVDVTLRGRLGSQISQSMGTISLINPINLAKQINSINPLLGTAFMMFSQQVTESELNQIPKLTKEYSNTNTTNFQAVLRGDAAKPNSAVKSFKWLATKSEIEEAQKALGSANLGITSLNKDELKKQINNSLTDEQKKQLEQGKQAVKAISKAVKNDEETKKVLKDQANQLKNSFFNQLKEQAQQQSN